MAPGKRAETEGIASRDRRTVLRGISAGLGGGLALVTGTTASARPGNDYTTCSYGRSCASYSGGYPPLQGYTQVDSARREAICEFGSRVVFPVATAVSLEDGVPISTTVVAKSWAAFSSGCYVLDQLDDAHDQQVDSAALYTDHSGGGSILQPPGDV